MTTRLGKDSAELVDALRALVRVPSGNPGDSEMRMVETIEGLTSHPGVGLERVLMAPGRPCLVAEVRGGRSGPTIVLNGHTDTVPVTDAPQWRHDPFAADIEDGRVYGRGACDMKGGLAVIIAILRHFAARPRSLGGRLIGHFAAGEECAEPGTLALLEAGYRGDFGIVLEPAKLQVATAARGAAFYRVVLDGHSGHGALPESATNPIDALPELLASLDGYRASIERRRHPLLGAPTCVATVVQGGSKENAIPGSCAVTLDRRLLPDETAAAVLLELRTQLPATIGEVGVTVDLVGDGFAPVEMSARSALVVALLDSLAEVGRPQAGPTGTPFSSDVRNLVLDAQMDAVTFGPGDIRQAHAVDEFIEIDQLDGARSALVELVHKLSVNHGRRS